MGDPEGKQPLKEHPGEFGKAALQEGEGYSVLQELMFHIEALFCTTSPSLMRF